MPISEPTTLLTDYLLAAVAIGLGGRLAAAAMGSRARQLWAAAFVFGGCAALAGGTVHGLRAWLDPLLTAWLWQCALLGSALAGALLLAGAAVNAWRGGALRLALVVITAKLVVELALIGGSGLSRDAVWAGAASVVLLLALTLSRARTDPESLGWLLLALAFAGAGLAVQAARLTLHPSFNHNDACHVLLTAALWPFYRAGLCLKN